MDRYEDTRKLLKSIAWEEAKGALRKVAVIEGGAFSSTAEPTRYTTIKDEVENFIKGFENAGYDE